MGTSHLHKVTVVSTSQVMSADSGIAVTDSNATAQLILPHCTAVMIC